jgi:hypothetical protein
MAAFKFLVLDMTSESWHRAAKLVPTLLHKPNGPKCIVVVISDLKSQLGSDINHHGTVRVFHKDRREMEEVFAYINDKTSLVRSSVMHAHRRLNKKTGISVSTTALFKRKASDAFEGTKRARLLDLPATKVGDECSVIVENDFESYKVVQGDIFEILNTTRNDFLDTLLERIGDDVFRKDLNPIMIRFLIEHPEHAMHSEYSKSLIESEVFKDQHLNYLLQDFVESDNCFNQFLEHLKSETTMPLPAELLCKFAQIKNINLAIYKQDCCTPGLIKKFQGKSGLKDAKHLLQGLNQDWYALKVNVKQALSFSP